MPLEPEIVDRLESARFAIANTRLSGGEVTDATMAAMMKWVLGELVDEPMIQQMSRRQGNQKRTCVIHGHGDRGCQYVVSSTNIPADWVLDKLRRGCSADEIRSKWYHDLPPDGVEAVIEWALETYGWRPSGAPATLDPEVMSGTPCFRETRVPVATLFDHLADDLSLSEIVDNFPTIDPDDARAVLVQAKNLILAGMTRPIRKFAEAFALRLQTLPDDRCLGDSPEDIIHDHPEVKLPAAFVASDAAWQESMHLGGVRVEVPKGDRAAFVEAALAGDMETMDRLAPGRKREQ
jgi:uncharacterized protein (DUF433 family)